MSRCFRIAVVVALLVMGGEIVTGADGTAAGQPAKKKAPALKLRYPAVVAIALDPEKAKRYGVTLAQVDAALTNSSFQPRTLTELQNVIVVSVNDRPVRLREIATIDVELTSRK